MLRPFRALAIAIIAAMAVAVSACGSSNSEDVKATLDKAFSTPIKSANVNLDVSLKLNGIKQLKDPVKLNIQGPYESGQSVTIPKVDFDVSASAAGQNFTAGFISTGTNAWVSFQGQNYEVGRAAVAQVNQQIRQAGGKKKSGGLSQFGIDPKRWLTDAKDEGTETLAGVETQYGWASLDVSAFVEDLNQVVAKGGGSVTGGATPPTLTPEQQK